MPIRTIAFFNWRYPYGGGEVVTFNLARFFREAGFRVLLYTGELVREKLRALDTETLELRPLPAPGGCKANANKEFLIESIRQEKVDVIIVQGVMEFPSAAIRQATSCKVIFCLHNKPFWEIQFLREQKPSQIANPTLARRIEYLLLRRPVYWLTPKLKKRVTKDYARLLRSVDKCVLLCDEYRRDFDAALTARYGPEIIQGKTAAILNPLTPALPGPETGKQKRVLYVGRLVHTHKRVDRLLKIWRRVEPRHPDWQLQIVGEGEERERLERDAARYGLANVQFLGYRDDMPAIYRAASVICLTSNFEGLPMSLMEGQQYGVIPVSFDSYAGIREIARNGQAGITVPAFSLRKYADRLNDLLDDPEAQERLRQQALLAAKRYDPQIIGQEWLRLFEKL